MGERTGETLGSLAKIPGQIPSDAGLYVREQFPSIGEAIEEEVVISCRIRQGGFSTEAKVGIKGHAAHPAPAVTVGLPKDWTDPGVSITIELGRIAEGNPLGSSLPNLASDLMPGDCCGRLGPLGFCGWRTK